MSGRGRAGHGPRWGDRGPWGCGGGPVRRLGAGGPPQSSGGNVGGGYDTFSAVSSMTKEVANETSSTPVNFRVTVCPA